MAACYLLLQGTSLEKTLVKLLLERYLPQSIGITDIEISCDLKQAQVNLDTKISDEELTSLQISLASDDKCGNLTVHLAPATILVSELPEDEDLKEYLELYFESKNHSSGGDVKNVDLHEEHRYAIVTFVNEDDLQSVLLKKDHILSDKPVHVKRIPPFWCPSPVAHNFDMKRSAETDNCSQGTSKKLANDQGKDETKYAMQTAWTPEGSGHHWRESEVSQMETDDTKYMNDMKAHTAKKSEYEKPQACVSPMKSISQMTLDESPCINQKSSTKAQDEQVIEDISSFPAGKIKYLSESISQHALDYQVNVETRYEQAFARLSFHGLKSNVMELKLKIFEEMQDISEIKLKLTKESCNLLQLDEVEQEACKNISKLKAKLTMVDNTFIVVGISDDCQKAASKIERMFKKDTVNVTEHHKNFLGSVKWQDCINNVRQNKLVQLNVSKDSVHLYGVDHAVAKEKNQLLSTLKKNSNKEQKIEIKKGLYRLFKQYQAQELLQIQLQTGVEVKPDKTGDKWYITCSGCVDDVDVACLKIRSLIDSVKYSTETCGKPGMAKYFLDRTSNGSRMIKGIEVDHAAIIEIRSGPTDATTPVTPVRAARAAFSPMRQVREKYIKVLKGDITKAKADAIVNSVANENKDLDKCGVIAKAFLAAGGDQVGKEYSSFGGLKCGEVTSTFHSGNLNCSLIIHASIRNWDGQRTKKMLCDVLRKCMKQLDLYGLTSIAFPTLGCGNLKYPPMEVVNCFKEVAAQFPNKQVNIIAFDENVYKVFNSALASYDTTIPKFGQSSRPKTFAPRKKDMQAVTFHINAMSDSIIQSVKTDIDKIISEFYTDLEIKDDTLEHVDDDEMKQLLSSKNDLAVVDIDPNNNKIMLYGQRFAVFEEEKRIRHELKSIGKKHKDPKNAKKYRGTKGYLQSLIQEEASAPSHWKKNTGKIKNFFLKNYIPSRKSVLVDVDASFHQAIDQLMQKTWVQQYVGHGADSVGLKHSKIQVKCVQRIENPSVYRDYRSGLSLVCEEALNCDIPPITKLNEQEILTASVNIPQLDAIRVKEVNEYFLFHGTKSNVVDSIVIQGADTRMSSKGLFGRGFYLAESSTKADQYADPRKSRQSGGDFYMVVFRVILGHIYHQKGSTDFKRPPCSVPGCHKCDCYHPQRCHSVMGTEKDGGVKLNFREFVVFDNKFAYPEFLVTYNRI